ncbi:MAG: hypothetical protein ACI9T7_001537 [Oleiphilaceae bacterium]|jgi:hypothetical protein
MSLFLYCTEKGLTWLREGRLPFLEATSLMDPFVNNTAIKHAKESIAVSDEELRVELKANYDALPESLSSLITFEYFKEQALLDRGSIEAKIRQRALPEVNTISPKQLKKLTLLCLYERPDNPALWQYHGNNHQGIVIELDQTHDFFTASKYKDAPQIFLPVKYGSDRPLKLKDAHPFASLFQRGDNFSNEREWRVLRPITVADKMLQIHDSLFHLHSMQTNIIKSVTFGSVMEAELKEKLMNLLKTDLRYRHITIFDCQLDPTQYLLHRVPIDRG